jgi:hypothetical protein
MLPGEVIPQRCASCGTRYPCARACGHLDCQAEREAQVERALEIDRHQARISDDSIRGSTPSGHHLFDEDGSL